MDNIEKAIKIEELRRDAENAKIAAVKYSGIYEYLMTKVAELEKPIPAEAPKDGV